MARKVLKILLTVSLLLQSLGANAWWEAGHMLVAEIAYRNLSLEAKDQVNKLLPLMAQEKTAVHRYDYDATHPNRSLMAVALWPDHLYQSPNKLYTSFAWHFIDQPLSFDGTKPSHELSPQNAVWALKTLSQNLKQADASLTLRARTLAMIVHFTGDLHQPLHAAALFSQQFPQGDAGGNKYLIDYTSPDGLQLDNLHKLWDSGLRLFYDMGFAANVNAPGDIEIIADKIIDDFPEAIFAEQGQDIDPQHWQAESYQLAKTAYQTPQESRPDDAYIKRGSVIVERQIALAGYRLAHLLNTLL